MEQPGTGSYIKWFSEIGKDVPVVVGKTASLAEMAKSRKINICRQAPSDYPEFAELLVAQKIRSI